MESGQKSYGVGSSEIKQEEKELIDQAFSWLSNGLSVLGGAGMVGAGLGLCTTGGGCLLGAPLVAHGANGIYEGSAGFKRGSSNVEGPLREGYKSLAVELGFDESVGNLAYNLIDLGVSVKGKLKLIPRLHESGRPIYKLWYYGRQDLERAYKQMSSRLLTLEIVGDLISTSNRKDDLKKAFVLDKENNHVSMIISEHDKVSNVGYIIDDCKLVVEVNVNGNRSYFECVEGEGR